MAARLNDAELNLLQRLSETYALPSSPHHLDPVAFNRYVRSRIPPRGARFTHDHRDTCAYIARSKNLNVVAYTANFVAAAPPAESAPEGSSGASGGAAAAAPDDSCDRDWGTGREAEQLYCRSHYHFTCTQREPHARPGEEVALPSGIGVRCRANGRNPVHPYFVRLEPSYIAARRKKGITTDCDELKMLERKFAYGYHAKEFDAARHILEQLPAAFKPATGGGGSSGAAAAVGIESSAWDGIIDSSTGAVVDGEALAPLTEWWRGVGQALVASFAPLPVWPAFLLVLPPPAPAPRQEQSPASSSSSSSSWCCDSDTVAVIIATIAGELCVLDKVYVKSTERWFGLPSVEYIEVFGVALADGKPRQEKQANNGKYEAPKDVTAEEVANS